MNQFSEYPVIYKQNVAWGDMDAFGHVNNVQYYRYIESARIAYFDALQVFTEDALTVVASSQCKYLKPVFYPDQLIIYTRIDEMRNSAIRMHYILWSEQQNQVVAEGEAVVVFVDKIEMKKMNIPTVLRERIINLENSVQHDLK
ncbi:MULTISPECIES: thioesterase family protein [unclassified Acinetobacter]|uniref:acyl-CoA thioesterase n=1 Tax=unclassified Acinetobacter TaxID=196816 RepID=UPI0025791144|nr:MULTISPECIES: thioesterase family protein [unclassified Acinetobacter]MDM1765186.1 acyl-CoA thioesterase [Acinetobacter sp. 226-1]MDM1768466.1 acyl-CoA thioesterase [Acinetobacter sp. 226-4]